jgi:hypothetical protein
MTPLADVVNALIWRELAAIGAIDAAVPRQTDPGYTFLFLETKLEKQANVTQLTTLLRMNSLQPEFSTGLTGIVLKTQAALVQAVDTTATLRAMRLVGRELVHQYTRSLEAVGAIASATFRKALGRAIVQDTILGAHIARRTGDPVDARELPRPLPEYFATDAARVCMRCLLDRPGSAAALVRDEPRPPQYICAACHQEVFEDLPPDLREQATRWPAELRDDRIIHHALSRPARLTAIHHVLHPLSGLPREVPQVALDRAIDFPSALATPGPTSGTPAAVRAIEPMSGGFEEDYVTTLFDPARVRAHW